MEDGKVRELRVLHAKAEKDFGRRAYSDSFNHIIVSMHGSHESGLDLACAIQLRNDLDKAIKSASLPNDLYMSLGGG